MGFMVCFLKRRSRNRESSHTVGRSRQSVTLGCKNRERRKVKTIKKVENCNACFFIDVTCAIVVNMISFVRLIYLPISAMERTTMSG
jgi:hypothetical protein